MVEIDKKSLKLFRKTVRESYPNECCGFLIGSELKSKTIIDTIYIPNEQYLWGTPNYIDINDDWWEEAHSKAEEVKLKVVGFIHSHPGYCDVSMSEADLALTDYFKQELDHICDPIMGVVGVWQTKRSGFRTKVGLWPMFDKHKVKIING